MKTKIITLIVGIFCSMFYGQVIRDTGSTTTTDSPSGGSGSGNGYHSIQLYPNPCTTSLNIKSKFPIVSYTIYNAENGKLIYNGSVFQINIPAARYHMTVMFDNGNRSSNYSFIKTNDQPLSIQRILIPQQL